MDETIEERLAAVERALTDGETDFSALAEAGDVAERVGALETRVEEHEQRLAELDAATQALRGYVGNVRAVNEEVRQQADRALELAQEHRDEGQTRGESATDKEPTLELGSEVKSGPDDRRANQEGHAKRERDRQTSTDKRQQTPDPTCPLCDDDGRTSTADERADERGASRHPVGRSDPTTGMTDGGVVDHSDGGSGDADGGLGRWIRTLL